MIIAVSDIHLGYEKSDEKNFKSFLRNFIVEEMGPDDHLVLLGDIFDFWRKKNLDCTLKSDDILGILLNLTTKVHYVVGNHDYYMLRIKNRFKDYETFDLNKYLRLDNNGSHFFFIHGYELDAIANYEPLTLCEYERLSEELCRTGNAFGRMFSELWGIKKKLKKPPEKRKSWKTKNVLLPKRVNHLDKLEKFACSMGKNVFLGMKESETLVFGHTHKPFLVENTANTGAWVRGTSNEYEANTYLIIEDGKMRLMQWRNGHKHVLADGATELFDAAV